VQRTDARTGHKRIRGKDAGQNAVQQPCRGKTASALGIGDDRHRLEAQNERVIVGERREVHNRRRKTPPDVEVLVRGVELERWQWKYHRVFLKLSVVNGQSRHGIGKVAM
jgi:hypothetical protein